MVYSFRVAVLDKVTDFLLFLGKLLIVGIVGKWMVVPFFLNNNNNNSHVFPISVDLIVFASYVAFTVFYSGIISFFFFSGRAKGVDVVPNLHYYWVPILVRE